VETVNVDIKGLDDVRKVFNNLAEKIANPDAQIMRRLGDATMDDIEDRFMTRGYGTWAPLSPATIKAKKGNTMVLIDTGTMFASLKPEVQGRYVRVLVPFGGKKRDPSVPGYHQQGTDRMPQRKIVEFTQKLAKSLETVVITWIVDMTKAFRKSV
jgi:hypothetical protein